MSNNNSNERIGKSLPSRNYKMKENTTKEAYDSFNFLLNMHSGYISDASRHNKHYTRPESKLYSIINKIKIILTPISDKYNNALEVALKLQTEYTKIDNYLYKALISLSISELLLVILIKAYKDTKKNLIIPEEIKKVISNIYNTQFRRYYQVVSDGMRIGELSPCGRLFSLITSNPSNIDSNYKYWGEDAGEYLFSLSPHDIEKAAQKWIVICSGPNAVVRRHVGFNELININKNNSTNTKQLVIKNLIDDSGKDIYYDVGNLEILNDIINPKSQSNQNNKSNRDKSKLFNDSVNSIFKSYGSLSLLEMSNLSRQLEIGKLSGQMALGKKRSVKRKPSVKRNSPNNRKRQVKGKSPNNRKRSH